MREIKFRAWDKMESKMIMFPTNEGLFSRIGLDYGSKCLRYELMQYTGLKDNNGKEIYEGDVVDCGVREGKSEVVFLNGCFGYYRPSSFGRTFTTNCYESLNNCEIIGNIHEHPELLTDVKGE